MTSDDRVNILLVDDQPAKLLSYEAILGELGENLIKANSAREALEHLLKNDITVILIDVIMPDLDGFELAAMIRSHPRFQKTAIIFVSAIAMTEIDLVKGYEHGGVDYVSVPVIPELLRAKVRVFAELYRKTSQLEALNAELEQRVRQRTAELAEANAELERRVEQRTREREVALAQVHEMQKLDSLGKLTGGLAHDFNNLLMVISTSLNLLGKRLPEDPRYARLIDSAKQSAARGATLTSRMLAFARRQELRLQPVDVRTLVEGLIEMLQRTLGPTIQITTRFEQHMVPVVADTGQLELALLNLALNARDAMPDGGSLAITARREMLATAAHNLRAGEYVCISVSDSGSGMDPETTMRAAEPFFTTKGIGKGTGLGLSMVHGLAAQSGGTMRIESQIGVGTTIELWLTVADVAAAELLEANMTTPALPGRTRRVLVVDDEPLVGAVTAEMLEDLGYAATVVSSGPLALEALGDGAGYDVVLTDHAMPGMTGLDLALQIRRTRPNLPIVVATGFAELPIKDGPELPRLSKPYSPEDLAKVLAGLISGERTNVVPISAARREVG